MFVNTNINRNTIRMTGPDKTENKRKYVCNLCDKIFHSKSGLSLHRRTLHFRNQSKDFKCDICDKTFFKQVGLMIHQRLHLIEKRTEETVIRQTVHKKLGKKISELYKVYQNVVSDVLYSSDSDCEYEVVQTIVKIKDDRKKAYACKYCEKKFVTAKSLERHLVKHSEQKLTYEHFENSLQKFDVDTINAENPEDPLSINAANTICAFQNSVQSNTQNNKTVAQEFTDVNEMKLEESDSKLKHEVTEYSYTVNNTPSYSCKLCNKTFQYAVNLANHKKFHMKQTALLMKPISTMDILSMVPSRKYRCWICNKAAYSQKIYLDNHMAVHKGEDLTKICRIDKSCDDASDLYTCTFCRRGFIKAGDFSVHLRRHINEKPHLCSVCGKAFSLKRYLLVHQRSHTQEKPFACEQCSKKFIHKSSLIEHLRTHAGVKPHVCSICSKTFTYYTGLTQHLRSHTSDKKHVCHICGKAFRSGGHFREHMRVHTGDRPYACDVCDKKYISKSSLTVHLRTHSGERPFECEVCKKSFIKAFGLTQHKRTHAVCNVVQIKDKH